MQILFVIILLLLLFVLLPLLFLGLVAYTKLRSLWCKLTGRPQTNPFGGFNGSFNTHSSSRSNATQGQQQQQTSQSGSSTSNNNGKKIFSADEGEYVDFEVVD